MDIREFDDLVRMEEANARAFAHETMKGIQRRFRQLVDPATCSITVRRPVGAR